MSSLLLAIISKVSSATSATSAITGSIQFCPLTIIKEQNKQDRRSTGLSIVI
jgi:hypothetical protein